MPTMTFDQVWERARTLSPEEMQRLRNLLDILLACEGQPLSPEDELDLELLKEGTLDQVPLPNRDHTAFDQWKPIEIEGKPLSETIIEERR